MTSVIFFFRGFAGFLVMFVFDVRSDKKLVGFGIGASETGGASTLSEERLSQFQVALTGRGASYVRAFAGKFVGAFAATGGGAAGLEDAKSMYTGMVAIS